jgi:hypothetical protein
VKVIVSGVERGTRRGETKGFAIYDFGIEDKRQK